MRAKSGAVLIGTGDAWGESVNLQDTDLALFVMIPWTPRAIGQWEGRFARLGQKRPVLIAYIIAAGTVDEHVAELLVDKLPAVGEVADDEVIREVEAAFSGTQEGLLERVADMFLTHGT
jgi:SNF2 family DNA or RNA helicase